MIRGAPSWRARLTPASYGVAGSWVVDTTTTLPGGAVGLIGVTTVVVLSQWVLFAPAELAKPGFKSFNAALTWGLSGFSNTTVWLIFGAFMFALGYEKTGLGRRISLGLVKTMGRRTLTLGYAVAFADLLLLQAGHRHGPEVMPLRFGKPRSTVVQSAPMRG